jgi:glycosyltransferase involved in cell wall biosynthesis
MKIYIIYFDWSNTSGNHAGMAYLARCLSEKFVEVKIVKMFNFKYKYFRVVNIIYSIYLAVKLRILLGENDKIILFEYLAKSCFQDIMAKFLLALQSKSRVCGLVHLSGNHLMEIYGSKEVIKRKLRPLNDIIVFGSSLNDFFVELGFNNVLTVFHYVDTNYYKPYSLKSKSSPINILCLGNIKRDFSKIRNIVMKSPEVQFNICQGVKDLSQYFDDLPNVKLYGFLSEPKLLELMQFNDVSLSIMEDTIGSNVITTSLATGLVPIVSDVGSIRDYCTEKESFLCLYENDFIKAIERLKNDDFMLRFMSESARDRALEFSLSNFYKLFKTIFIDD